MLRIALMGLAIISFVVGLIMALIRYEPFSTVLLWYMIGVLCLGLSNKRNQRTRMKRWKKVPNKEEEKWK